MDPVNRAPSPVFIMDEDIKKEIDNTYDIAKRILLNCGCISAREIATLCKVNTDISNQVMDKIKIEFMNKGHFYQ